MAMPRRRAGPGSPLPACSRRKRRAPAPTHTLTGGMATARSYLCSPNSVGLLRPRRRSKSLLQRSARSPTCSAGQKKKSSAKAKPAARQKNTAEPAALAGAAKGKIAAPGAEVKSLLEGAARFRGRGRGSAANKLLREAAKVQAAGKQPSADTTNQRERRGAQAIEEGIFAGCEALGGAARTVGKLLSRPAICELMRTDAWHDSIIDLQHPLACGDRAALSQLAEKRSWLRRRSAERKGRNTAHRCRAGHLCSACSGGRRKNRHGWEDGGVPPPSWRHPPAAASSCEAAERNDRLRCRRCTGPLCPAASGTIWQQVGCRSSSCKKVKGL